MPSYNGSTVVTGILYENGQIVVKNGRKTDIDKIKVNNCTMGSSKFKVKIFYGPLQLEPDQPIVNNCSMGTSRSKQKILVLGNQLEPDQPIVNNCTVVGSRQKKVIVVP